MSDKATWGEFSFIADYLSPLNDASALGLADDAALYQPPNGFDVVITTDSLVEAVHFPATAAPDLVARRALACNISDLAAKGAKPVGCLMNLGIAPHWDGVWLRGFVAALGDGLKHWGVSLWGGDTVKSATPFVSLTLHGLVPHGQMVKRSGAQIGDDVYVTGTIGDGFLGLKDMSAAYADPKPPLALGQGLVGLATAALDISDGLLADLDHLCQASACAMQINAATIPLSEAGRAYATDVTGLGALLGGGDDLQIAFTADPSKADALAALASETQTQISKIGVVRQGEEQAHKAILCDENGHPMDVARRGYRHF